MASDLNNGFEKLIRNKLEDYKTPVGPNNWDAIEKSLLRSKRLRYFYTTAGIVAAAAVLFLITLNLPNNKKHNDEQTTVVLQDSTSKTTQPDKQTAIPNIDGQSAPKTADTDRQIPANQTKPEQTATNPAPIYSATTNTITITTQAEQADMYPEDPPVKERLRIAPQNITGTSISLSSPNKLNLPAYMHPIESLSSQNSDKKNNIQQNQYTAAKLDKHDLNNKKWSVSISFGAGNYQAPTINSKSSELIMAAPLLTSSNSVDYIRNTYRDEVKIPDNADAQHGLPLSAKFLVRKDFNTRWAIESGLSYTFLSTKYNWSKTTVNQQLHYLGIPLNVVCYAVSKPSWNIYASAGGMVEKGVYANINRSDNLDPKAQMRGLQWSINGAIGVTYKLRKGWGLFFEPQVGYFFDNGQPESIRTEWPVSFGFGAGLRFNF
jgi:hypothetical protein